MRGHGSEELRQYDNLDMLEDSYGINLLPLAVFSTEQYDDAEVFHPRKLRSRPSGPGIWPYIPGCKAISVIQFKLESQLVRRRQI